MRDFADEGSAIHSAIAALDLALIMLAQARFQDLATLAAQVLVIFEALNVHREAVAAARLFHEAARREAISRQFLDALRSFLELAEADKAARFKPPI